MVDNKTNSADSAKAALGVAGGPDPYAPIWWIETLKQQYQTAREQAAERLSEQRPVAARLWFAKASAYADLLAIYYGARNIGEHEARTRWTERARVYHRRAFGQRNAIAENIGAEMP